MANEIGAVRVVLGADTAQFSRGLKEAQTKLSAFQKSFAVVSVALAAAAAGFAAKIAASVRSVIDQADELYKASQKIGVPVEELSRLKHAAELSGVSFEQLNTALGRFNRNILEGAQGLSTPVRAFKLLGVEIKATDGSLKTVGQILPEIADKFSKMRDGPEKTALAMQLLGRSGADMIPLLNMGAAGMRELMNEADQLGIVIDTKAAMAAEQFNDNLDRLQKLGDGVSVAIVNAWIPRVASFSDTMVDAGKATRALTIELGELIGKREQTTGFFDTVLQSVERMSPGKDR